MLKTDQKLLRTRGAEKGFDVEIAAVATALPAVSLTQAEASQLAAALFPNLSHLERLYDNTGIAGRRLCRPLSWYSEPHDWEDRTEVFQEEALALLEQVTLKATEAAGVDLSELGALLVNTITGLAVPSLDAKLMNRLDLPASVERIPLFGLGCGGGVAGLARAARYARALPDKPILFLTVDLCSLCLRTNDPSKAMFVAAALFGDGAAGVVLREARDRGDSGRGRIAAAGDHFWRGTEHIMGWDIRNDGFGVVLSPELPDLLINRLRPAIEAFLASNGMSLGEFDGFLFHPGGSKVLRAVQKALGLTQEDLSLSFDVLREFGNMSSPTALFTLERAIAAGARGRHLLAAFGPGFSAYFLVVDL